MRVAYGVHELTMTRLTGWLRYGHSSDTLALLQPSVSSIITIIIDDIVNSSVERRTGHASVPAPGDRPRRSPGARIFLDVCADIAGIGRSSTGHAGSGAPARRAQRGLVKALPRTPAELRRSTHASAGAYLGPVRPFF